jgi:hypothetical protein
LREKAVNAGPEPDPPGDGLGGGLGGGLCGFFGRDAG